MKSFLVIGLGRFGQHLTRKLMELGNEVMVVDRSEERVAAMAPIATAACVGDCQDEQVLASLGVGNFDVCFVCVSDDFQTSLEATATLKELGARYVVARADREKQIKFLKAIGADHVVHTEMDMAHRVAMRFSARNAFDYIELTDEYAIYEIPPLASWVGKTIMELGIRNRYHINILAVKTGDELRPMPGANYAFTGTEHILALAGREDVRKLLRKIESNSSFE